MWSVPKEYKALLAGDLNAKHPFWNSVFSNPSGVKLLNLLHTNVFEISAPQCPIHYSPTGNCDMLDIVVHKNVRLSEDIVSDLLDSDHLPILFHFLDHIRTRNILEPVDEFTDWERFQSLASEISPRIQIKSEKQADKAARNFTALIASAYRLSRSKITLSDFNKDVTGPESLIKHKRRLRKLW
jgi:hypothetical protein